MKFNGRDLVAVVGIVSQTALIYSGHNGAAMSLIGIIIGWYFGTRQASKDAS